MKNNRVSSMLLGLSAALSRRQGGLTVPTYKRNILGSLVRNNLMNRQNYTPYCLNCETLVRTRFNGSQFECGGCGWVSSFEDEFIAGYKERWQIDEGRP